MDESTVAKFATVQKEGGSQLVTNCHQLKMRFPKDGKRYNTDVANTVIKNWGILHLATLWVQ